MREGLGHGAQRGELQAPGFGFKADLGLRKLAHDARHRPLLAVHLTGAGAAELLARRVVADASQRLVLQKAVQERRMRRVNPDLERLQPVGVPQALERKAVRGRRGEAVEGGEGRRCAALRHVTATAQPRKQHAAFLNDGVAALPHAIAQLASGGLGRCFQAASIDRKLPAMKRTAQAAALLDAFAPAKRQVSAAMRAIAVQHSPGARGVLEQHEVLPQQTNRLDRPLRHARIERGVEFIDQRRRLPVLAQQGAAGRAGPDACQTFVLFGVHGFPVNPTWQSL